MKNFLNKKMLQENTIFSCISGFAEIKQNKIHKVFTKLFLSLILLSAVGGFSADYIFPDLKVLWISILAVAVFALIIKGAFLDVYCPYFLVNIFLSKTEVDHQIQYLHDLYEGKIKLISVALKSIKEELLFLEQSDILIGEIKAYFDDGLPPSYIQYITEDSALQEYFLKEFKPDCISRLIKEKKELSNEYSQLQTDYAAWTASIGII